jgi:hypothetical protein
MEPTGLRVRRPYLLITLIVASITAVNLVSAGAAMALPQLPPIVLELLAELIVAVLAIALSTALQSWREGRFLCISQAKRPAPLLGSSTSGAPGRRCCSCRHLPNAHRGIRLLPSLGLPHWFC